MAASRSPVFDFEVCNLSPIACMVAATFFAALQSVNPIPSSTSLALSPLAFSSIDLAPSRSSVQLSSQLRP